MRLFDGITDSMDMNLSKLQEAVEGRGAWQAWHATVHWVVKNWTGVSKLTITTNI